MNRITRREIIRSIGFALSYLPFSKNFYNIINEDIDSKLKKETTVNISSVKYVNTEALSMVNTVPNTTNLIQEQLDQLREDIKNINNKFHIHTEVDNIKLSRIINLERSIKEMTTIYDRKIEESEKKYSDKNKEIICTAAFIIFLISLLYFLIII